MALSPIPFRVVLTDLKTLLLRNEWVRWLQSVKDAIDASAQRLGGTTLTTQAASIVATAILAVSATGLYRVSVAGIITRAATVSSGLQLTVRWTSRGVACAIAGANVTTNVAGTLAQITPICYADVGTTITIEAAYASVGATSMLYALDARVEALP